MLNESVTRSLLLPELRFIKEVIDKDKRYFYCEKESTFEVCPKCATKCSTIYDHVFGVFVFNSGKQCFLNLLV